MNSSVLLRAVGVVFLLAGGSGAAQDEEPAIYHPLSGQALAPAPDGGVYVAGNTGGTLGPEPEAGQGPSVDEPIQIQETDVFLAQLDREGEIVWLKQLGTGSDDTVNALTVAPNGDLLIVGATAGDLGRWTFEALGHEPPEEPEEPAGTAYVARFTPAGELLWLTQFGRGPRDFALDVAVNEAGEAFVVGALTKDEQSPTTLFLRETFWYRDAFLARFDAEGEPVWLRPLVLDADQVASNIVLNADGEPIVTGWTAAEFPRGGQVHVRSAFIGWFNDKGQLQQIRRDNYAYAIDPFPLALKPDGGVYVGEMTLGPAEPDYEPGTTRGQSSSATVASLAPDGTSDWALLFGAWRSYRALDLELTADNGVVIVGRGNGEVGGEPLGLSDAFVIKYDHAGNRQWATRFGTELFDEARAVTRSGDRLFVTGYLNRSWDDPRTQGEYWFLAALTDDGELLWFRRYENRRHVMPDRPHNPDSPAAGREP